MELTEAKSAAAALLIDEDSFEQMFKEHFNALHSYATLMLRDEELAEDIVQQMFLKLWEKRQELAVETSLRAFLYRCVHNDCLNYLKHLKVKAGFESHTTYAMKDHTVEPIQDVQLKELQQRLQAALAELPEQCLTVFQMSRFEELKYREIADRLGVSVKAVEKQMGKALKLLRYKLVDFLPLVLMLLSPDQYI